MIDYKAEPCPYCGGRLYAGAIGCDTCQEYKMARAIEHALQLTTEAAGSGNLQRCRQVCENLSVYLTGII